MQNSNYNRGPVMFVNAEIRRAKETGKMYLWSKPFNLEEVIRTLGTTVVSMTVSTPKNARNEFQRVVVLKPADEQYLPKAQQTGQQVNQQASGLDNMPI